VVIVRWGAVGCEVLTRGSGVVDVGDEVRTNLVAVLQQHVHSVVVADEAGETVGVGVDVLF
jgi:hypothetical protein